MGSSRYLHESVCAKRHVSRGEVGREVVLVVDVVEGGRAGQTDHAGQRGGALHVQQEIHRELLRLGVQRLLPEPLRAPLRRLAPAAAAAAAAGGPGAARRTSGSARA